MPEIIVFTISLVAVLVGSDWLGNAATAIAHRFSLPRVIIGASLVSVITTLPEITVAATSAAEKVPDVGVGTVLGSPIANLGLVFGLLLIFSKNSISKEYHLRATQFFLGVLLVVFLLLLKGVVGPVSSVGLIFLGVIYLVIQSLIAGMDRGVVDFLESNFERLKNYLVSIKNYNQIFYLAAGGLLLFLGANFLVGSSITLANLLGVPELFVGFLVIALGTSLPEAFTAINSIIKKRVRLSSGNLFGASVLDLTVGLGIIGMFGQLQVDVKVLYLTVGTLATYSFLGILAIIGNFPQRILGALLIVTYFVFLGWFSLLEL